MDDRQGNRSSKAPIIKGLNASISPVNIQMDNHLVIGGNRHYHQETNSKSPTILDPFAEKLDLSTPIPRYLCSRSPMVAKLPTIGDAFSTPLADIISSNYRSVIIKQYPSSSSGSTSFGSQGGGSSLSPLSSVENLESPPIRSPQIYGTPVKVDEEVIVMDGILVSSIPGGARMMRSTSDSGGSGGFSSGKCLYKTDICHSWEDLGSCRYGHKCQFAHGKEELRPARLPVKNKSKIRISHQLMGLTLTAAEASLIARTEATTPLAIGAAAVTRRTAAISFHDMNTKPTPISAVSIKDWSPEDDGIEIALPNSKTGEISKREDVDQHIHNVLFGSSIEGQPKKRLPVFTEICSENIQKE